MYLSGVNFMSARVRKRSGFGIITRALSLSMLLLAGPMGCAGSARFKPIAKPMIQKKEQAKHVALGNQQKDTRKDKAALAKAIGSIEGDLLALQGKKALLELSDVLAKLVKLKGQMDISRLEPLGIQGWSVYSELKGNLARKDKDSDRLLQISERAGSICAQIRIGFEKERLLAQISISNRIEAHKKKIRKIAGNVIRRIRFRKEIGALRKGLSELRRERKAIDQMKGHLDAIPESAALDRMMSENRDRFIELRRALEELDKLDSTLTIRRRIRWLKEIKAIQERQGIDSSSTKSDIADANSMLKKMEKKFFPNK
jgi:hypothetical protein